MQVTPLRRELRGAKLLFVSDGAKRAWKSR